MQRSLMANAAAPISPAATTAPGPEPPCSNYRERLRAGGRGAFQRAFDMGLVPKNMRHDQWNSMSTPTTTPTSMMGQQMDSNIGASEGYGMCGDAHQMWGGGVQSMQSGASDFWMMPTDGRAATHMNSQQVTYMQQMSQMMPQAAMQPQPPQQTPQMYSSSMPFQPQQQQQPMPLAQYPASQGAHHASPPCSVVSLPQAALDGTSMCMGSAPPCTTPVATASDSTPSDVDRCTSFLKFSFGDFDSDFMAAQLKAAADDQIYED